MIKTRSVIALGAAVTLSGCAAMYPQSREAYIEEVTNYDGVFNALALIESASVSTPFEDAVANIESQVSNCISTDLEEARVGAHFTNFSTTLERNNTTFKKVSSERAGQDQTQIDIYTGTNYRPVFDAIQHWAGGSNACHGVGGKD